MKRNQSEIMEQYRLWSEDPYFDADTRGELRGLADDPKAIEERFSGNLSFGTGGLRAELGAGTLRMNEYTIAQATEGLARYIESLGEEAKRRGVVVSYDSRIKSADFAEVTALVLAAHGIKVYLSDQLRPTPMLSFALRHFGCVAGVMITASHNPAKYNGYKAYGEDGGQMPPEAADVVLREMEEIRDFRSLRRMDKREAAEAGLLVYFGEEVDRAYDETLLSLRINPEIVARHRDLKIVYTPLHGSGNLPVQRILKASGFRRILVVKEQEQPDGRFPTVPYPNPEEREALEMAIDLAEKNEASLVIATDPDSDRMGIVVRQKDGSYQVLSGNQIGLLLMDYILDAKQKRGCLPEKSFCATTIVSTRLARPVCEHYGVTLFETLTGFKYIAELMEKFDEKGEMHFQFGFEESYGYLTGLDVRDKDAVVASMLIAEMAAVAADEGLTLADRLEDFYRRFSFGKEKTISITLEGLEGMAKISACMEKLRADDAFTLRSSRILARRDYQTRERVDFRTGEKTPLELPVSDVLLYELEGIDQCCIRPSGTEPKLKIYFACYGHEKEAVLDRLEKLSAEMEKKIRTMI